MTTADLVREAALIVPPAGASKAIAVHDGTHHRAAFLVHDRLRSAPVGPSFTKPREASAFVDLLNGDRPASRSALEVKPGSLSGDPSHRAQIEASDDEAMPGTPGIEPATLTDPAHEAAAGASSLPSAASRG